MRHRFLWALLASSCAAPANAAIVSIDFDDGYVDGYLAASTLATYGMHATYFSVTSFTGGKSGYMTLDQLHALEAAGHEIGAHTVTHPDLSLLTPSEAQRQVCGSRDYLLRNGFDVRSFAYPFGGDANVEGIVAGCGFNSARTVGASSPGFVAETVPPADPFAIQNLGSIRATTSLADIQRWVTQAEAANGWLHLIFHRICDGACDPYSISTADFATLIDWLAQRRVLGTVVKTQREVMGGAPLAAVPPLPPTARTTGNLLLDPSLEDVDPSGVPACWTRVGWGSNAAAWSLASPAYDGAWAQGASISSYVDGGQRLMPNLDLGDCAPPAVLGHAYKVTGSYKSTARPVWVFMYRAANGQWTWWTQSNQLPASASWTSSSFTTPPLPAGASAVSFGLSLYGVGALTVDDFTLLDQGAVPPAVALASPADASFVRGTVSLTASASSVLGIDHVDFLVNGSPAGTVASPPYSTTWNSVSLADGPAQVTANAVDSAGNASSATVNVTVANQAGLLLNPSLETLNKAGAPGCWQRVQWGTNTAAWSLTNDSHAGSYAQRVDVSAFTSGGNRLMPTLDSGPCAPPGVPGHTYTITGWYKSSVSPTLVVNYRNASGAWVWWTQSAYLPVGGSWTPVTFTTPALPPGATAVSFGISLYGVGSLTVDDFGLTMN